MMNKLSNRTLKLVIEALTHSNYIEREYSLQALQQSTNAFEFMFKQDKLNVEVIQSVHALIMFELLEDKHCGKFRNCEVSIGGRICKNIGPLAIANKVDDWITDWKFILNKEFDRSISEFETYYGCNPYKKDYSKDQVKDYIIQSHVQFEHVHPFIDGNGRVGRLIMLWQCLKAGIDPIVIKEGINQQEYYEWFLTEEKIEKLEKEALTQSILLSEQIKKDWNLI